MNFTDCLTPATLSAIDEDVPAWLLPATITDRAVLLAGGRPDGDYTLAWR